MIPVFNTLLDQCLRAFGVWFCCSLACDCLLAFGALLWFVVSLVLVDLIFGWRGFFVLRF